MGILILLLLLACPVTLSAQQAKPPCRDSALLVSPVVTKIIRRSRTLDMKHLREWIETLKEQRDEHLKTQKTYKPSEPIWATYQQVITDLNERINNLESDLATYPSEADLIQRFARVSGLCADPAPSLSRPALPAKPPPPFDFMRGL